LKSMLSGGYETHPFDDSFFHWQDERFVNR